MGLEQGPRLRGVEAGPVGFRQFPPGPALAVEQRLPAEGGDPAIEFGVRKAVGADIAEVVPEGAFIQITPRGPAAVAVFQAVDDDGGHKRSPGGVRRL